MNNGRDGHLWIIALVLAVGLTLAINCFTFAILYEAIFHTKESGVSENATQILTGWGGGVIGILGAFIGYRAGINGQPPDQPPEQEPAP